MIVETGSIPHIPVLLNEVIDALNPHKGGLYLDCTFGRGGYSKAILAADPSIKLLGIDRDPDAIEYGKGLQKEYPGRLFLMQSTFAAAFDHISDRQDLSEFHPGFDGIVFDLGVSSPQLDHKERGFSFMAEAPLDMRMSREGLSAYDIVNRYEADEIADILYHYGEEHQSRRIARKIVEERQKAPIETTTRLADLIGSAIGRGKAKIHPATKSFQALRIAVNDELKEVETALEKALERLKIGGVLVVVTFHSLEDRIVKNFMNLKSGKSEGVNRHDMLALMQEEKEAFVTLLSKKAIKPTAEEITLNPRSRSAKLRACVKVKEALNV